MRQDIVSPVDGPESTFAGPAVYMLRDQSAAILYIGQCENWRKRRSLHVSTKAWWPEVRTVTILNVSDPGDRLEVEASLIRLLRPTHNVQMVGVVEFEQVNNARVRSLMRLRGVNQVALGIALGLDQTTVSKRLTGKREWRISELPLVAALLRCSVSDLLSEAEHPRSAVSA